VAKLVEVARVDQIPPEGGLSVALGRCTIAVFNVRGRIFAIDGACIRCASLLASGVVEGGEVACRSCGWRYDVRTGRLPGVPRLRIETFNVELAESRVMVWNPFV
jgi:3-phenylpropionate/trans-cinnamate dioxygenase ferredoxin subunit